MELVSLKQYKQPSRELHPLNLHMKLVNCKQQTLNCSYSLIQLLNTKIYDITHLTAVGQHSDKDCKYQITLCIKVFMVA
jgi:hypothetical protein